MEPRGLKNSIDSSFSPHHCVSAARFSALAARAADTVLTEAFSVLWPDAPHRVLRSAVEAAERLPDGPVAMMRIGDTDEPVPRFAVYCPSRETTGHVEAMALYAGESVENITSLEPAGAIIQELVRGAEGLLARMKVI